MGQMSLIGPRPLPAELYNDYKEMIPQYDLRHSVPPGITGLAQVWQGYTNTPQGEVLKWKYDTYYIANIGFNQDISILLTTFLSPGKQSRNILKSQVQSFHQKPD